MIILRYCVLDDIPAPGALTTNSMVDLGVVMGAFGPNKDQVFQWQIDFTVKLFDGYTISRTAVLPGAITYGKYSNVKIRIGEAVTREDAKQQFSGLKNPGDGNRIEAALTQARDVLFSSDYGARDVAPKILLVFLDSFIEGERMDCLQNIVRELRRRGVKIVLVGIGEEFDELQSKLLVADAGVSFTSTNFEELNARAVQIASATTTG